MYYFYLNIRLVEIGSSFWINKNSCRIGFDSFEGIFSIYLIRVYFMIQAFYKKQVSQQREQAHSEDDQA